MSRYVKSFKNIGEYKNKNNQLISLVIYDNKLLEKYKAIGTKVENLKK